ncbi:lysophospholipase [Metschnikowia aff. pulcherrima]|uniref:Lysophospholipase n=1 Tax=Metschnikowia aff. pulcherrima TaxID=2163413 RepID=A0A4V1AEW7_9ASCO|nr:lysophospholipase [Metschnikowia aff. pulcherrima]
MRLTSLIWAASALAGYAPYQVDCPDGSLVRTANNLSTEEADWVSERHKVTDKYLETFLNDANLEDFDASSFLSNTTDGRSITIGIAFSGGGYRAMLAGAGQLAALDNRTEGAHTEGLGGLLQASTYLVGLSGGNWLVGSVVVNNFTSVQDIVNNKIDIWDLEHSIVNMGGWNLVKAYEYYKDLYDDVSAKEDAGFEVSLTDTWGRALSHQFFPELTAFGESLLWSSIQDIDEFANHEMPFPIVVANGRTPGTQLISGNSTVFEVSPYELGSWDPSLYAFTKTKYLGSKVSDGESLNGTCVSGFDNAGFIMGTSSTLFNQFVLQINTTSLLSTLKSLISSLLEDVSNEENDIAVYKPNPFQHYEEAGIKSIVQNDTLYLVDGGEDGQNIPIYPLLQHPRGVDVVFAYDNSADTDQYWPNGTSMIASYQRQFLDQGNGTIFPHVPDSATFRNLNMTAKPAFFGCSAKNLTSLLPDGADEDEVYNSPVIVYTANRPFSFYSNTSTFKLSWENEQKLGMIQNGFETASRLNSTLDEDWKTCVACAIIRREQERQGIEQSDQCKLCFEEYCWDGTIDDLTPGLNFTTEGTTNGEESTGNTTSSGVSLIGSSANHGIYQVLGYCLLAVVACTFSVV